MNYDNLHNEHGFTIIELLIATLIFSLILILCTTGLIQVSRTYYKGITATNTQNASRNVMDTISQNIQFSGGSVITLKPTGKINGFCIDNNRYSYLTDEELVSGNADATQNQAPYVFLVDQLGAACDKNTPVLDLNNPGAGPYKELMIPDARLAAFSLTQVDSDLFKISVRIVYGDNAVLNPNIGPNFHNQCATTSIGTQFCSISDSTTVVQRRI